MGIDNIHILVQVDPPYPTPEQVQVAREQLLIAAHQRGEHPYGSMRRDCPLCQNE